MGVEAIKDFEPPLRAPVALPEAFARFFYFVVRLHKPLYYHTPLKLGVHENSGKRLRWGARV